MRYVMETNIAGYPAVRTIKLLYSSLSRRTDMFNSIKLNMIYSNNIQQTLHISEQDLMYGKNNELYRIYIHCETIT